MPFQIVRNDITNMCADAIVNTANPKPVIGSGVDSAIHEKAGPQLLQARQKIGSIQVGCAAITPAFELQAKYVIHTVGPAWHHGLFGEAKQLRSCYDSALQLALENGCQSIVFPLISTGNYGFPRDKALQIAISAFSEFLMEHEMQIFLAVFDNKSYKLSEKLFDGVASFIDEHYVQANSCAARYPRNPAPCQPMSAASHRFPLESTDSLVLAGPQAVSLQDMLKQEDAGFTETLLNLIDKTGKKDSAIYKKALLSKQHFSKIRNNPDYKPTKPTAVALALALELDLPATRDLIGRAGYALNNSSKFDLIIRYFIEQKNYNIVEINCVLFEYDQNLLG